nr:retrovirus-related Pol polyprotein from transposon TNT 1-94 [Tanacetum cinerariifolium]
MHNNIMVAGSRDHPPMLATGRYAQWQSRFLRYIDTGPSAVKTLLTMYPENKAHYESKKEAIHLLLTGIGLQQGESINIQDVKTNLFWEFGKFTSHDGESMESYYSRFYKIMNEMIINNLTIATITLNINVVCATCGKCVFNSNHDACVSKFLNDVNARTKKPKVVPISTRQPKSQANKSVATPPKKTVASESTIQKSKSHYRMLYEKTRNITIKRVYYIEGLNHNLFSVGQFCDVDLEVAFQKSTCFVRDLQGNDLLTGNHGSDLYTISLQETSSSTTIYFMAKASPTQAWLWHRRLSYLNFDYVNLLSNKDIVIGLPKLKYVKDQLCSFCELSKAKKKFIQEKGCSKFKTTAKFASCGLMWSNAGC